MSWGGYGHIKPGDILVLKCSMRGSELTRHIVLSSRSKAGYGSEVAHRLYTIYNSEPSPLPAYNVGATFSLTRKQMINDYTAVWSKLC